MIVLTKGTTANITVTLTEKTTLVTPYYLAVFTSQQSKEVVKFVLPTDKSSYTDRFNYYTITVNTYFSSKPTGLWDYIIYEQTSSSNTDIANVTGVVEKGVMTLNESTSFTVTDYNPTSTTIKAHEPA